MHKIDDFSEVLSEEEQQIIQEIKDDFVPVISQKDINKTCRIAALYYTEGQNMKNKNFWRVAFSCLSATSVVFWFLCAFLLGSCVVISFLLVRCEIEPLAFMTALSPVPVLMFAICELQYHDENLLQLEKTCKYAPEKIYFARLWVGMILNAFFVLLVGVIAFRHYENFVQLYFCAFIAMFFIGAVALFFMSLLNNVLPLSFMMAAWILSAVGMLSQCEILDWVIGTSTKQFVIVTVFSFGLYVIATIKSTAKLYARL